MSRSYRIRVRETLRRVIRAADHVSSQLELLEILPPEQMAELLVQELAARGFQRCGAKAVRKQKGVTVTVELDTGTVTVQAEAQQKVELTSEKDGRAPMTTRAQGPRRSANACAANSSRHWKRKPKTSRRGSKRKSPTSSKANWPM